MKKVCLLFYLTLCVCFFSFAQNTHSVITLNLAGTEVSSSNTVYKQALEAVGYTVKINLAGDIPIARVEHMLELGEISVHAVGETPDRTAKFLKIDVAISSNIMGHRIFFITKGSQKDYDSIFTLEDLIVSGKIAGMGSRWADVLIWKANELPVFEQSGDWKTLFKMVGSDQRGIDYLSRGAHEIAREYLDHPYLDVEQNLVLVYPKDHVVYVSPKEKELFEILQYALLRAEEKGLIESVIKKYHPDVYLPPINLQNRRVIHLQMPNR